MGLRSIIMVIAENRFSIASADCKKASRFSDWLVPGWHKGPKSTWK